MTDKKFILRFSGIEMKSLYRSILLDVFTRASQNWPAGAIGACWRNRHRPVPFLPASGREPDSIGFFHLLKNRQQPEPISNVGDEFGKYLQNAFAIVSFGEDLVRDGTPDAFILLKNAIIVVKADHDDVQRAGYILTHPDLSAHELMEIAPTLETMFPGRFEIKDTA